MSVPDEEQRLVVQTYIMPPESSYTDFDPSDEFFNASPAGPQPPEIEVSPFKLPSYASMKKNVLFFDMDNCLYPQSSGIAESVRQRILLFCSHIHNMTEKEAMFLAKKYHTDYGLAIKGLLLHHPGTDPSYYDKFVDGGINIEAALSEHSSSQMRALFENIKNHSNASQIWILTNAGSSHALRTLGFLFGTTFIPKDSSCPASTSQVFSKSAWFDGIIYCDYTVPNFLCKPQVALFKAVEKMTKIGTDAQVQPILIDDSLANVFGALKAGWKAVLVSESASSEHVFLENNQRYVRFVSFDFYYFLVIRTIYDIEKVLHFVA